MEKITPQLIIYKPQAVSRSSKENDRNSMNSILKEKKAKMFPSFNEKNYELNGNKINSNPNNNFNDNTNKSKNRKIFENQNPFVTSQYNSYTKDIPDHNYNTHLGSNFSQKTQNRNPNRSLNKQTNKIKSNRNTHINKLMRDQSSNKEIFYNKNRFNTNSLNSKNQTSHNRLFNELQTVCAKNNASVLDTLLNSSCNIKDYKASYLTKNILDLSLHNNTNNNFHRNKFNTNSIEKGAFSPNSLVYGEVPNEKFTLENTINLNSIEYNNTQGFHINYNPVRDSSINFAFSSKNESEDINRNKNSAKPNKFFNRFSNSFNSSNFNDINLNVQNNNYSFYFNLRDKKDININNNKTISSIDSGVNNNFKNGKKPNDLNNYKDKNHTDNSSDSCNLLNTNKFIQGAAYEKSANCFEDQLHRKNKSASSFLLNREKDEGNYFDISDHNDLQNDLTEKIKSLFNHTRNNNFKNDNNFSFNIVKTEGSFPTTNNSCNSKLVTMKSSNNHKNNNSQNHNSKLNKNRALIIVDKTYKIIEGNKKILINNNDLNSRPKGDENNKNHNSSMNNSTKDKMFFINTDKKYGLNNYQEPSYYTKNKSREKSKNQKQIQNEEKIGGLRNVNLFDLNINKGNFVVLDEENKNNRILNDISTVSHNNFRGMISENGMKYDSLPIHKSIYSGLGFQEAKISPINSPGKEPKREGNNTNENSKINTNENFNPNNRAISNLLSEEPSLIYGNLNMNNNNLNDNCENSNADNKNLVHKLNQKESNRFGLNTNENGEIDNNLQDRNNNNDNQNKIEDDDANEEDMDNCCNVSDTEEFGEVKNIKINKIYDSHNWNNLNILRRNLSGKQEINEFANNISKNNIDNIAENTANLNSYRKNFIKKKPTIFNVDSILTPLNPKVLKDFDKNDNEKNINLQIQINNNPNFNMKEKKNEIEEKKSVSDPREEVEGEDMDIGGSEIYGVGVQPLENIAVKTKRSCMENVENPNGEGIGALRTNDIKPKCLESKKTSENERNDSNRNNVYNETDNPTKKSNEKDDFKNYDQKIDDLQSQLLELQKDINESVKNNYNNYENIKINAQAMRDKISGLVLNEIQLSKEFEQFIKEKYSNNNVNLLSLNTLKKINTHQTYNNTNYMQSVKSINEISVDNFVDVVSQKDSKNILNDNDVEHIIRDKIEFLKRAKNENFANKERKYLEIIEKLFASIKEIQGEKALNEKNSSKKNLLDNVNLNNESNVKDKNDNKKFLHASSMKEKRQTNFKLSRINEAIKIDDEDIKNSFIQHSEGVNQNDSLLEEFLSFKNENLFDKYKFEIQDKYVLPKTVTIVKEIQSEGKFIKFYDNNVIDVISKTQNLTRLFQDGFSINYYKNRDIKQTFPEGYFYYYYNKSKSIEFNFENKENFVAYLFQNGQLEKHFNDGRKHIKFPDGSFKILRPNGEEVNFSNNSIQRKDKLGRVVAIKNIV